MNKVTKKNEIKRFPLTFTYRGVTFKQFMRTDNVLYYQAYWKKDRPLFFVALVFRHEFKKEKFIVEYLREKNYDKDSFWMTNDVQKALGYYEALTEIFFEKDNKESKILDYDL